MKSLVEYLINENIKILKPSNDKIATAIINYITSNYKVVFMNGDTVDYFIEDITNNNNAKKNRDDVLKNIKKFDKLYVMKCWDGGTYGLIHSPYNIASFCYVGNNPECQWYFGVNGKTVTGVKYICGNYGGEDIVSVMGTFKIKI